MDHLRWSSLLAHWNGGRGPLYSLLGSALSGSIQAGHLAPAERLPSERRLAELLQISRSTVVLAYDDLAAGGWVVRRQGSGTHVSATAPRHSEVLALRSPVRASLSSPEEIDLTIAVPILGAAQQERLRRASEDAFAGGAWAEASYHPLGLSELRAELAQMYTREGLPTRMEQVVVTTGAQQAISVIAAALLTRGDVALLETPTYFGAIDVFRAAGARLLGVPVGPRGIDTAEFQSRLQAGPRLAFLTPTFQNPTGAVMPASTRERLADLITDAGLPTIEDDCLIDLGFLETGGDALSNSAHPDSVPPHSVPPHLVPPRLASFAPKGSVICAGSLSKLFWAGLRIGWMRLPDSLAAPVVQSKTLADFGSAVPSQVTALALLRELPALRCERRASIQPARDLLVSLLREQLPGWTFQVPTGGQFLWVQLPTRNVSGFTHLARRHGVQLFPGASMGVTDLPDSFLRLPFTLPYGQLPEAVRRLTLAWESFQARGLGERLA